MGHLDRPGDRAPGDRPDAEPRVIAHSSVAAGLPAGAATAPRGAGLSEPDLDDLRAQRSGALESLVAVRGRLLAGVAYVVLQNRAEAQTVAKQVLARAWSDPDVVAGELSVWLAGAAATTALAAQARSRAVDPLPPGVEFAHLAESGAAADLPRIARAIAEMAPRMRAVVGLRFVAGLSAEEIAAALTLPAETATSELAAARRRLRLSLPEEPVQPDAAVIPWSTSITAELEQRLDQRLRRAFAALVEALPFGVDAASVRAAVAASPAGRPASWPMHTRARRRTVAFGALAVLVAAGLIAILSRVAPGPAEASPSSAASAQARATPVVVPVDAPISLAGCGIRPPNAPLAFAGWATTGSLALPDSRLPAGRPVYALVTQSDAQWSAPSGAGPSGAASGGSASGGTAIPQPILPPVIGRMACLYEPTSDTTAIIGLPADWAPPETVDGCPSPSDGEFAGYREVGGPRARLILPADPAAWELGDSTYLLLFRMLRPSAAGQTLTTWAQPLAAGSAITAGTVQTGPAKPDRRADSAPLPGAASYFLVRLRLPQSGCWVVNVALDRELVGSAVIPIGVR